MYGFYVDKTTNEISLNRNFSRFSSQYKTTKSPSQTKFSKIFKTFRPIWSKTGVFLQNFICKNMVKSQGIDTGVTPEARQWLSQPNKYYVIYVISGWLTLSLHNSSTSLAKSFLKLTFFLVVLLLTLFL